MMLSEICNLLNMVSFVTELLEDIKYTRRFLGSATDERSGCQGKCMKIIPQIYP